MGVETDGDGVKKHDAMQKTEAEMKVDEAAKEDGAAAEVNAEKDAAAHRLAAERAARAEEEKRIGAEAQRRKVAQEAEKKKEEMKEQMGALQVRGSLAEANRILRLLREGDGSATWRKVWHNDTTGAMSHRTEWVNFKETWRVKAAIAAAAQFRWVVDGDTWYRINRIDGDKSSEQRRSYQQGPPPAPWPPLQPRGAPAQPPPGTTFWGSKRKEFADAQQQNAEWLRQAAQPARDELQAEFKEDFKRSMLELVRDLVKQELSEQAAAPPAAAAAQEDGAAGAQELQVQLQQLQQTVAELKTSYKELQGHYHKAFAGQGAAEDNSKKLAAIVEVQAKRIRELEGQFQTPLRSAFAASHQGETPSLANMPVKKGGMFSPGPVERADGKMWSPEGDKGADLKLPPCVPGVPFFFNPAVPVYVVAPASPVQAGSKSPGKIQTAGKEEAKGPEVRKEEEGGQPAAAAALAAAVAPARAAAAALVAPVAAAEPADAAVCPQGRKGTGSKVRLPDRQPGESGVTPDAKVTRSAEPVGAASSEEEAGGLAPMRLNSNFSAAAGQAGPAEGRPEWRQTGSGEWRIAGKGKGKDKDKRGFKPTRC